MPWLPWKASTTAMRARAGAARARVRVRLGERPGPRLGPLAVLPADREVVVEQDAARTVLVVAARRRRRRRPRAGARSAAPRPRARRAGSACRSRAPTGPSGVSSSISRIIPSRSRSSGPSLVDQPVAVVVDRRGRCAPPPVPRERQREPGRQGWPTGIGHEGGLGRQVLRMSREIRDARRSRPGSRKREIPSRPRGGAWRAPASGRGPVTPRTGRRRARARRRCVPSSSARPARSAPASEQGVLVLEERE